MGLEDKFYPDDGSLLTKYDNFMIKSAGSVGEIYQDFTGKSYRELVKTSYGVATLGFVSSAPFLNPFSLLFAVNTYCNYCEPKFRTPLEEEIIQEAMKAPKKGRKIGRLLISAVGLGMLCLGHHDLEQGSDYITFTLGFGLQLYGISSIPWVFAEYLSLSDTPQPPKKTVFARAKDAIKDFVPGNLVPERVAVSSLTSL